MSKHVKDDALLASLRHMGAEVNAVIEHLEPHAEKDNRIAYTRFLTSVFALLITTIPAASRYELYEMIDIACETARGLPALDKH